MKIHEMLLQLDSTLEILTIVDGRFSEAGNYLGICQEKVNGHDHLHIYKAQMASLGWSKELDNVELPFAALGRWQEVANRPGNNRFTASVIYKTIEELNHGIISQFQINNLGDPESI